MAAMPMSASRAGASNSMRPCLATTARLSGHQQARRGAVDAGFQFGIAVVDRVLRKLRHDALGRVDEEAGVGRAQHAGVVVAVTGCDHLVVQALERVDRMELLVRLVFLARLLLPVLR